MRSISLSAVLVLGVACIGQEVHVERGANRVALGVWGRPYEAAHEKIVPVLILGCTRHGKKIEHQLTFVAGGPIAEWSRGVIATGAGGPLLDVSIGGSSKLTTQWVTYSGEASTFRYVGRSGREPERAKFIQAILSAGTITINFTPFYGVSSPAPATFDVTKLRDEVQKYSECDFSSKR